MRKIAWRIRMADQVLPVHLRAETMHLIMLDLRRTLGSLSPDSEFGILSPLSRPDEPE
jgi:hypothetical protein